MSLEDVPKWAAKLADNIISEYNLSSATPIEDIVIKTAEYFKPIYPEFQITVPNPSLGRNSFQVLTKDGKKPPPFSAAQSQIADIKLIIRWTYSIIIGRFDK